MTSQHRSAERGFALPLTIFLITLLTLMLATGLTRVRADRQAGDSSEDATRALSIAHNGLQTYIASRSARPPDGDSVRINVVGGYASVVARIVQRPADTLVRQTYIVRSTGYVIQPLVGSAPVAERTVSQFAWWQTGSMDVRGAMTAPNGMRRRIRERETIFDGRDMCGIEPDAPSVRTTSIAGPPMTGDETHVPAQSLAPGAGPAIADETDIDWAAAISDGLVPDYDYIRRNNNGWSIQRIDGAATLQNAYGTGILVVTGNLTFDGSWAIWYGIVLVGGQVRLNARFNQVRGAIVSGLNEQLGQNPGQSLFGGENNRRTYIFHDSCYKERALRPLTGMVQVSNAWADNWATY